VDLMCVGSGRPCEADAQCSAWECRSDVAIVGLTGAFQACAPKVCAVDADCGDKGFYCLLGAAGSAAKGFEVQGHCARRTEGGQGLGEPCNDKKGDGLPDVVCANRAYCLDGRCSAACSEDADCGKFGRCSLREMAFDADGDGEEDAVLEAPVCLWAGADPQPCETQQDCDGGLACTPFVPVSAKEAPVLQCMEPPPGSVGTMCGEAAFGQQCANRVCLWERPEDGLPGYCSTPCRDRSDCPELAPVGPHQYRWLCEAVVFSSAGTLDRSDDRLVSWCVPVPGESTLEDCFGQFRCSDPAEVCRASVRAGAPGFERAISFVCVRPAGGKAVGEQCDPEGDGSECATGTCMRTAMKGLGFCTRLCASDQDCAEVPGASCVQAVKLPGAPPLLAPECGMVGKCVTCQDHWDCGDGFACADISNFPGNPDRRCLPTCENDTDCLDPGTFCVESSGAKVCLPVQCG